MILLALMSLICGRFSGIGRSTLVKANMDTVVYEGLAMWVLAVGAGILIGCNLQLFSLEIPSAF